MAIFQATAMDDITDLFIADRIAVVRTHVASTPIEADLVSSVPEGMSPEVFSVVSLGPTSIRVTFEHAAIDNDALSNPDNYIITPTLEVSLVTPEVHSYPSYVDLEISEQKTGTTYTMTLQRIVRL